MDWFFLLTVPMKKIPGKIIVAKSFLHRGAYYILKNVL